MTLVKIAEDAGVALNTARKALRGDVSVRPYLRSRVLKSAARLEYRPNLVARGLKHRRLDIVPISVTSLHEPYFGELAEHLSDDLVAAGYEPALCMDSRRLLQLAETLNTCESILAYADFENLAHPLARTQPVVTINAPFHRSAKLACVGSDFESAYHQAAEAVLADGRRRVALLSPVYRRMAGKNWPYDKFHTVEAAIPDGGGRLVRPDDGPSFVDELQLMTALRHKPKAIDCVFCENDVHAARLLARLWSAGFRVPEDIRLVGCDANLPLTGCWSIKIDTAELARMAVESLRELLAGKQFVEPRTTRPTPVDSEGNAL